MKRFLLTAIMAFAAAPALATDVSISVGQPGFYGHIDIGNAYPQPRLIYRQPVIVERAPAYAPERPIYLHVPPGQARHWRKHCAEYNACGRPVYFVQDSWYNNVYAPRYREDHGDRGRERGYENRGNHGHDDERGRGHGRDHGHGNGHERGHDD
ncbi:MAG TPA: hypothetical protein VMV97_00225 [Sulfuriferula sp.]|nr:hypothetical protein [Sulfuriferula sp.]